MLRSRSSSLQERYILWVHSEVTCGDVSEGSGEMKFMSFKAATLLISLDTLFKH